MSPLLRAHAPRPQCAGTTNQFMCGKQGEAACKKRCKPATTADNCVCTEIYAPVCSANGACQPCMRRRLAVAAGWLLPRSGRPVRAAWPPPTAASRCRHGVLERVRGALREAEAAVCVRQLDGVHGRVQEGSGCAHLQVHGWSAQGHVSSALGGGGASGRCHRCPASSHATFMPADPPSSCRRVCGYDGQLYPTRSCLSCNGVPLRFACKARKGCKSLCESKGRLP